MATIEPRKIVCEMGAARRALGRAEKLVPSLKNHCSMTCQLHALERPQFSRSRREGFLTTKIRAGRVTATATTKKTGMTLLGYLSSFLNMWWIWGSFPYRNGAGTTGGWVLTSCLSSMSKASVMRPLAEPKEPMTMVAWRGLLEEKNVVGMSFWVCSYTIVGINSKKWAGSF